MRCTFAISYEQTFLNCSFSLVEIPIMGVISVPALSCDNFIGVLLRWMIFVVALFRSKYFAVPKYAPST